MKIRPLLLKLFIGSAFLLPCLAALAQTTQTAPQDSQKSRTFVPRPHLVGQQHGKEAGRLPGDGNLPETGSALPLLSAIGAGVLLGGLLSARRTRK